MKPSGSTSEKKKKNIHGHLVSLGRFQGVPETHHRRRSHRSSTGPGGFGDRELVGSKTARDRWDRVKCSYLHLTESSRSTFGETILVADFAPCGSTESSARTYTLLKAAFRLLVKQYLLLTLHLAVPPSQVLVFTP